MKVKIIKTGEILDLTHRDAQRRVLQGKAYWYKEPIEDNFTRLKELIKIAKPIESVKKKPKYKKSRNEDNS